jgi:anti-sigma B factor antagonist
MGFHDDRLTNEQLILHYLQRRLDERSQNEFEAHYLECDECFEELAATELLHSGLLRAAALQRRDVSGVVMLDFAVPANLTAGSPGIDELSAYVLQGSDKKVLIDLSRVSRIDSTGLGVLLSCYSHVIRNQGSLKLLRPPQKLRKLFQITNIGSVLEAFDDEAQALQSFHD